MFLLVFQIPTNAQTETPEPAPIEFTGTVESAGDGTITVAGLPVDISGADISSSADGIDSGASLRTFLVVGTTVRVTGVLRGGVVIATSIEIIIIIQPETPTPEPTTTPEADDDESDDDGAINIEKFISADGGVTFVDADAAPGPEIELEGQVAFRFVVTNSGDETLTNLTLSDSVFDTSGCAVPQILEPEAFFECNIGPFDVTEGQHTNVATATGLVIDDDDDPEIVSDVDTANYFGGDRPSIAVEKFVSVAGGGWEDADAAPGPQVEPGDDVAFRFVVTNDGTVPLTGLSLSDSMFDTSSCALPATLEPEASTECVIGPFAAAEDQHTNTATASATVVDSDVVVTATDTASYFGGDEDELPVIIVIEGPVTEINVNIITIYNIQIEVDPDDPILTIIQIGDEIRVSGELVDNDTTVIVLVAITIIIVDVDIFISDDGDIWRDPENCSNPPPPWAPAVGWRQRCEGGGSSGGGGGGGMGMGMGMGDDDD